MASRGADWVVEKGAELVELLDTALDPVRIVAAAAPDFLDARTPGRSRASSWRPSTSGSPGNWLERRGFDGRVVRSYGATEVFPPEDADCIVDNTATGATLKANGLMIFDELMRSSTRLYACPRSLDDPGKRGTDRAFRGPGSLGAGCPQAGDAGGQRAGRPPGGVVAILPCMREPTISPLHHDAGFAVKAAVPRTDLPELIRAIKERGGTDIVVFSDRADRAVSDGAPRSASVERRTAETEIAVELEPRRRGPRRGRRPAWAFSTTC